MHGQTSSLPPCRIVVCVNTEFVGYHFWNEAPCEVGYLGFPHRHLFKVSVALEVVESDRQVEFHLLRTDICKIITNSQHIFGSFAVYDPVKATAVRTSCEDMALFLANELNKLYGNRVRRVSIFEDGECGAMVEY